jgi:hypothetical protein
LFTNQQQIVLLHPADVDARMPGAAGVLLFEP